MIKLTLYLPLVLLICRSVPTSTEEASHILQKRQAFSANSKNLICRYMNDGENRVATGRFTILNIEPTLCTHLIYNFVELDPDVGVTTAHGNAETKSFVQFNNLKRYNKELKTILYARGPAVGTYEGFVEDNTKRKEFPKLVLQYLRKYNFDGLEIHFTYSPTDKENFLKAFRDEIENEARTSKKAPLLLVLNIDDIEELQRVDPDMKALTANLDWVNIQTFNYHAAYDGYASPSYPKFKIDPKITVNYSINPILDKGVDPKKIIMGVSAHGRSFNVTRSEDVFVRPPIGITIGGSINLDVVGNVWTSFYEICSIMEGKKDWVIVAGDRYPNGSFAFNGDQRFRFDDPYILKVKVQYAIRRNLGGVLFNTLGSDDFRGKCYNRVAFPLIKAVKETLEKNGTDVEYPPQFETDIDINSLLPNGGSCTVPKETEDSKYTAYCSNKKYGPGDVVIQGCKLYVSCIKGNALSPGSNKEAVCSSQFWFPSVPQCASICDKLKPEKVEVVCYRGSEKLNCNDTLVSGTRVLPSCLPHFRPENRVDYREIQCDKDGHWDKKLYKCTPDCGKLAFSGTTLIFNGTKEKYGNSPWHVGIYDVEKKDDYVLICGGTIISVRLVISAAHCFFDNHKLKRQPPEKYEVMVSKLTRNYFTIDGDAQKAYKIKEIRFPDSGFQGPETNYVGDIVILVLREKIKLSNYVLLACIDIVAVSFNPGDGALGKVVGWGVDDDKNAKGSQVLLQANLPYLNHSACLDAIDKDFRPFVTLDKFCAGVEGGPGVRNGDSGGGLLFKDPVHSLYYVRGIVSLKPSTTTSTAMFTDVSYYSSWVAGILNEFKEEKTTLGLGTEEPPLVFRPDTSKRTR